MNTKKNCIFKIILFFTVLIAIELCLGLATIVSHRAAQLLASPKAPPAVSDERLGNIPNPLYLTHDYRGFRNLKTIKQADIVALGDSQTYGTGVKPRNAWPKQLQSMTGKTVYSMAFGGYGPTHSLMLWGEAMVLSPRIVIEAFYSGNDLYDSFNHVYKEGQLQELKSSDPHLRADIVQAERADPLDDKIGRLFRMGRAPAPDSKVVPGADSTTFYPLRQFSEHSKIYGLLRRALHELKRLRDKPGITQRDPETEWAMLHVFAKSNPDYLHLFDNDRFKTVFTTAYRDAALDLGDPRIFEGLQISLRAIQSMHLLAANRGVRFIVLMIPTKARVFRPLMQEQPEDYQRLVEHGQEIWSVSKQFFHDNGIEYVDALPSLRGKFAKGINPYPISQDGHPNKNGHHAIAGLMAEHIK